VYIYLMSLKKAIKIILGLIVTVTILILIRISIRVFIGDWFPVNTNSMIPTIIPGDKIWVNKLIFGARIYKNFRFFDGDSLQTFRVKGWRKIRRGDVVVFNAPITKFGIDSITFRIDYVYVKRCVGLPGDTVDIQNQENEWNKWDIIDRTSRQSFSGAIYVPMKGDTLYMNNLNRKLYRTVIKYETGGLIPQEYHIFRNNYYFMYGDNLFQSFDSRNFGFVPEEFIIGVSKRVLFNNYRGWKQKFNGRRVLKRFR